MKDNQTIKIYIFEIWLEENEGKVSRRIQIAGKDALYNFAKIITKSFGFYFDHCFGFYDNFNRLNNSTKAFELFVDVGETPLSEITKGVKKTKVSQAFENIGEKMLFFFDYGDEWRFTVKLIDIKDVSKDIKIKPAVLQKIGKSPMQYPSCDE
ncbi:MAG: hypothetical protein A2539_04605 [Elusimicrobia bacterium RIFOXYD2_FULL_34_15]|nr:MAG: hypothetical protein A2539_04605 [Elusimicrobia bacterium RIFOXYD2_FULL_34_15]